MKKTVFSRERSLLHHLVLHAYDVPAAIGLFDGMTGIMLVIAHYARARKLPVIEGAADFLMERITDGLAKTDPIGLGHGLAGIGWGIEYLIQHGYMEGCATDITADMDNRIMSLDIRHLTDESLETGIEGLAHYVIAHVQGASLQGTQAFDDTYLHDWQSRLQHLADTHPHEQCWPRLLEELTATMRGQAYHQLTLSRFIIPRHTAPMKRLGLRDGLAGYLENRLPAEESGIIEKGGAL